jgi:hypothetical protein
VSSLLSEVVLIGAVMVSIPQGGDAISNPVEVETLSQMQNGATSSTPSLAITRHPPHLVGHHAYNKHVSMRAKRVGVWGYTAKEKYQTKITRRLNLFRGQVFAVYYVGCWPSGFCWPSESCWLSGCYWASGCCWPSGC